MEGAESARATHRAVRGARAAGLAVVGLALAATSAAAQILWDQPRMIGPESPGGFGVYWMRTESLPGSGDAAFATWALPGFGGSVAVRGGAGEGATGEIAGFGGVDVRAPLARHTEEQPLDVEWHAGAGVSGGDYLLVAVPTGVSVGRSWSSGAVWFAPYVSLGATGEVRIGDDAPDEEFVVEPTAEVGVDLSFDSARRFVLRAAASLGDRQAVAVGLAVTGGR